jgi:hypothetical protein
MEPLLESPDARDLRIEHLWKKLDPQNKGELDFNGLKKGLIRIDHRKQPHSKRPGTEWLICVSSEKCQRYAQRCGEGDR